MGHFGTIGVHRVEGLLGGNGQRARRGDEPTAFPVHEMLVRLQALISEKSCTFSAGQAYYILGSVGYCFVSWGRIGFDRMDEAGVACRGWSAGHVKS
ncbi:MAG: hypothetical protein KatS3mg110_0104 [Pirellulaceae bacterium]|nr:MAG: hypothetical protein KatS3mg110_0104 [Pirellulaceae bacterium]